jgi:hypothetical protein
LRAKILNDAYNQLADALRCSSASSMSSSQDRMEPLQRAFDALDTSTLTSASISAPRMVDHASTPTPSQSVDFGLDETMNSHSTITSQTLREARQELEDLTVDEDIGTLEPISRSNSAAADSESGLSDDGSQHSRKELTKQNKSSSSQSSKSKLRQATTRNKENKSESPAPDWQLVPLETSQQPVEEE